MDAKEQTMRRKDLRGDQEVVGAVVSMPARSWARCVGLNISGLVRFCLMLVICLRGVYYGGWGKTSDLR